MQADPLSSRPSSSETLTTEDHSHPQLEPSQPEKEYLNDRLAGEDATDQAHRNAGVNKLNLPPRDAAPGQPGSTGTTQDDLEKQSPEKAHDDAFLVKWDGTNDPEDPRNLSHGHKWAIVLIIAFSSFCVTVNSTIYTFTYEQLEPEFGVSREVATLGLSMFVVGLALGPLFLAPLSEFYGRRVVYLSAFVMVFIWIIPCAVAKNIETIIITRFFDGMAGSVFLSVAGGTVGDMFVKSELSGPMMVYSGSPFIGPAVGPIIGGFINQYTNWRWTFWVLLIWSGVQLGLIAFIIPETYHPVMLRRKAIRLRRETGDDRWKAPIEIMEKSILQTVLWSCIRPFQLLFLEPMCLSLCLLSAILLGILYLFFGAFPLVFERNHGFSLSEVGLSFLGLFVGMMLAIVSDPIWRIYYHRLVHRLEAQTGEKDASEPEFRLPPTVIGVHFCWIGLFGFGWTTFAFVPWIAPIIFSGVIGFGIVACYGGIFTFLVESYPLYAASALAANSFLRSMFAAGFPLFGVQMYNTLGDQWASSLLAFLCLLMAPFPFLFFLYGKRIRKYSKFAKSSETT